MKPDNKPKQHHFVPQCYLRSFTDTDGKLFAINISKVKLRHQKTTTRFSPAQLCYKLDYYTIFSSHLNAQFQLSDLDDLFIENEVLQSLEQLYPTIQKKLLIDHQLSLSEAIALSDFIVQLKLRNPYWVKSTLEPKKAEWIDTAMQKTQKKLSVLDRFQHIPDMLKEFIIERIKSESKQHTDFAKKMQLFSLAQRYLRSDPDNAKLRQAIVDCKWQVWQAPPFGPFFITSDNPGYAIGRDNLFYNTKFTNGFLFYFPLSPLHCLTISDGDKDNTFSNSKVEKHIPLITVNADWVVHANDRSLHHINNYLIGGDDWYLSHIIKNNSPVTI